MYAKILILAGALTLSQNVFSFSVELDEAVTPKSISKIISTIDKKISEGETELKFKLDSEGGEVPSALRMANYLREKRQQGLQVTTQVNSRCNSACTIIFAAGEVRKAAGGAEFYFHSVGVQGAGSNHDAVQAQWSRIWLNEIAGVDPRLAAELDADEITVGKDNERTYYGRKLFNQGYSYVTELL